MIILHPAFVDDALIGQVQQADGCLIGAGAPTLDRVRASVIEHEWGHALERSATGSVAAKAWEARQAMVQEQRELTYADGSRQTLARWQWDYLTPPGEPIMGPDSHPRSMYAGENAKEWIAEAFADGLLNPDNPSQAAIDVHRWITEWVLPL